MFTFPTSNWEKRYVKRIQQVTINLTGATSATATIDPVDTTTSFVILQGWSNTAGTVDNSKHLIRVELTNSTTVTVYSNTSPGADTITVNAVVIMAKVSLVESIEQGAVSISAATSGTAAISSIDTSRTAIFFLGATTNDVSSSYAKGLCSVRITAATQVTAEVNTANTMTVGFVVVQFRANVIQSMQYINSSFSGSDVFGKNDITISSVNTANTMLAYGGQKTSAAGPANGLFYYLLTTSTNISAQRSGTVGTAASTDTMCVIEFKPGIIERLQRGTLSLNGVSSADATLNPAINPDYSIANCCWHRIGLNTPAGTSFAKVKLIDLDTVTASKGDAAAITVDLSWEAFEFN